ncbi:hypothetical protein OEZ86_004046 [Tetradesmus obliquus]|uniref:Uncharacterized protein n=2 Tax=Tetradesmus obliquus TaxID=3088 RepID=A0ABY8U6Y4_TETOB|nr:hypothetical protein OEZ85_002074 [Tetradesmus obliquus]WIA35631.1 hypothetical protein OEZ86_004046 [Tetradesmus obliquus]
MAKSQRSSRQKALRTQRANRSAPWVAEAEAKRMEALQKCLESEPVPIVSSIPEAAADEEQQQRGREGGGSSGADAMAVEQQQPKSGKKKKGVKVGSSVLAGKRGVAKKKGAKTQAMLRAQFGKKTKKQRR